MKNPELDDAVGCPVCGLKLSLRLCNSRKGKVSIMLKCPQDGKHFRGFIADKEFVTAVVQRVESDSPRDAGGSAE